MTNKTSSNGNGDGQDTALVVIEDGMMPALTKNYPLVVQMADQLMSLHPAAKAVGVDAMRSVAMLALTTGANPLPGTNGIHAWVDNKGKVCIQLGIGFLRGEVEKVGGLLWCERPRPMSDDEKKKYGIPAGVTAAYCRAALKNAVFGLMREARENGIVLSLPEAKNEVAAEGMGTVGAQEYAKQGRAQIWTATERAERDLIRHLVPIMQEARDRFVTGEFVTGGLDWRPSEFVKAHDSAKLSAGYNHHNANADLWGDAPVIVEDEPAWIVDGDGVIAGESADLTAANPGYEYDWRQAADTADDLDSWAMAVYQLTESAYPNGATQVKAGYAKLFGDFNPTNQHKRLAREVFEWYTEQRVNSKSGKGLVEKAQARFTELLASEAAELEAEMDIVFGPRNDDQPETAGEIGGNFAD